MQLYTMNQVMSLAGIYCSDSEMERDLKFWQWIEDRKYRIVKNQTNNLDGSTISIEILEE